MIVKIGDRLRFKEDGCLVVVKEVREPTIDGFTIVVLTHIKDCRCDRWDPAWDKMTWQVGGVWFEHAEDPFLRFARELYESKNRPKNKV